MHLAVVGLNQQRAPLAVRERLAVAPAALSDALAALRPHVREGFVFSTCNRIEVWVVAPSVAAALAVGREFLARRAADLWDLWAGRAYEHADASAIHHLFEVASGLDSMVLGEAQILGQLRAALEAAQRERLSAGILGHVGAAAVACGKRVRAETGIGRHALSVVSVALNEAVRLLGTWEGKRVVLVGAGSVAELVLKHLDSQRSVCLTVVGRTSERATSVAARYGATARPFSELREALADADALIACTAAPHHVVTSGDLIAAGRHRSEQPLICLDLGVPRDIDPSVAGFSWLRLVDLDGMQSAAAHNRAVREREARHARAIAEEEFNRFMKWWRVRDVIPTIASVRSSADALRDAEVARALARLPGLSAREERVVRALASRLVGKLLHAPTATLREHADPTLAAAMRVLFAVRDEDRTSVPAPNANDSTVSASDERMVQPIPQP